MLTYLLEQVRELERIDELDLCVLAAPWNVRELRAGLRSPVRLVRVPNLALRIVYEQVLMPLRHRGWDVLYCPGNFCPQIAWGLPTVVTVHNVRYFGRGRRHLANWGLRERAEIALAHASVRHASAVVVISRSLFNEIAEEGLPTTNCRIILSGLPSWPAESQKPRGVGSDFPFLLSLANDYPHKRLDDLVKGWATAFGGRPDPPKLVFAGGISADRQTAHRAYVPPVHRDCLIYLGRVGNRNSVRWLLEHARAMVSTSELEGFPLTPPEAGSLGCPLLLTDIPPHREVAGENAIYFPVGDLAALAEALKRVPTAPGKHVWHWPMTWEQNAGELAILFKELGRHHR